MGGRPNSAQAQLLRQENKEFLLENPEISAQKSVEFMKQLTGVAISTISFLRNIFPSSAFSTKKLDGTKVWLLKGSDDIPGTHTLINWVKSAFDAVHSHILKKMVLVIEQEGGFGTLEIYTFNFSYNHQEISYQLISNTDEKKMFVDNTKLPDNIKKAVQQLLRSVLTLTSSLEPLPDNCLINIRLEFCDHVPLNYELPKYFQEADSLGINFPPNIHTLKLGKVESKYTGIALSTKSVLNQAEDAEDELVQSSQPEPDYSKSFVSPEFNTSQPNMQDIVTINLSETMSSVNLRDKVIKCICEFNNEASAVIKCFSCATFQHKACYKLLDDQEVENHTCVNCHELNNPEKTCTDPDLITNKARKDEALYRRALIVCLSTLRVSSNTFVSQLSLPRLLAQNIFNQLDTDGFLRPASGKGNIRTVKTEYLRDKVYSKYFSTPSNFQNTESMDTEENEILNDITNTNRTKKRGRDQDESNSLMADNTGVQQKRLKYATNRRIYDIQACN